MRTIGVFYLNGQAGVPVFGAMSLVAITPAPEAISAAIKLKERQ